MSFHWNSPFDSGCLQKAYWTSTFLVRITQDSRILVTQLIYAWLLSLAAHVARWWQHTRMPLLILSVRVAEPPVTGRGMYGGRVVPNRISGRDALTQTLQFLALAFSHGHDPTRAA